MRKRFFSYESVTFISLRSLSFNLADALIGGFAPAIAMLLYHYTGQEASFSFYILFCSLLSLSAYLAMKDRHKPK